MKQRSHLEDMGVVGRKLKWSLTEWDMECINLAQDTEK